MYRFKLNIFEYKRVRLDHTVYIRRKSSAATFTIHSPIKQNFLEKVLFVCWFFLNKTITSYFGSKHSKFFHFYVHGFVCKVSFCVVLETFLQLLGISNALEFFFGALKRLKLSAYKITFTRIPLEIP